MLAVIIEMMNARISFLGVLVVDFAH